MPAYRLRHLPTGTLLSTPWETMTDALLSIIALPTADQYEAVPAVDEDAIYDAALALLVQGEHAGRYLECPGCTALVHHADRHDHARRCLELRSLTLAESRP